MSEDAVLAEAQWLYAQMPGRKPWSKLDHNQRGNWITLARATVARRESELED